METKDKLREQTSNKEITNNFAEAIKMMNQIIHYNDYQVKVKNVVTSTKDSIPELELNQDELGNLSQNGHKDLAKRIHFFNKKRSLRAMNSLFSVFYRRGILNEKISIKLSKKELEINRLRSIYKIMMAKTEEARLAYKKEKGDFYKKKLAQ